MFFLTFFYKLIQLIELNNNNEDISFNHFKLINLNLARLFYILFVLTFVLLVLPLPANQRGVGRACTWLLQNLIGRES